MTTPSGQASNWRRCTAPDGRIVEPAQGGVGPAGLHLGVVVEELDDSAATRPDSRVCSFGETALALETDGRHAKRRGNGARRSLG